MEKVKKVPEIRFGGFDGEWKQNFLSKIAHLGSSKRVHREDYVPIGIPFFRGTEISKLGENSINQDLLYISDDLYQKLKNEYGVPQNGDILITAVGTIGNAYLIENDLEFYFKDGNLIWISNIEINNKYLSTFLKNGIGKKRVLESAIGSNQKALTMDKLGLISIDFPEPEEQKVIGDFFQNLDNLIKNHNTQLKKLTQLKKAMLVKLFPQDGATTPAIRFKGFDGEWEEKTVEELGEIVTGSTPSTSEKSFYSKNGIPWVTPTDIKNNVTYSTARHLSEKGIKVARVVPKNSILVTCIASIGKNTLLGTEGSLNQQINALVPNKEICHYYFLFVLSHIWSNHMKKMAAIGTMQIVNKNDFSNISTYVPQLKEQEQIGNYFKNLDNLIDHHSTQLKKLNQIKKACLSKLFVSQD